jgi:uncharacterized RDD family membrane protein YckC
MNKQTIIPPTLSVTEEKEFGEGRYGGIMDRFLALLIDQMILFVIHIAIIFPVIGVAFTLGSLLLMPVAAVGVGAMPSVWLAAVVIDWLYYAFQESSPRGATIGKRAMNLRVLDEEGNRLTFVKASVRYFSKILSAMIMMLGYVMALFTKRKQALHDLIAGTIVVDNG